MPKRRAIPPIRGASNNAAFFDTGAPYAPASAMENVIPYDVTQDRPRIGTRPGTAEYFYGTFGNGSRVQGCGVVSRGRTVSGYQLGTSTLLEGDDGSGHTQGAVAGNVWLYAANRGLQAYAYEDVTAGGPYSDTGVDTQPNRSVAVIALSPDGTKVITGKTYSDGTANSVARVTCRNASTLAVIWSKKLSDTGINRYVNAIAVSADWVFVATNHFVRIYKLSDGSNPAVGSSVNGMNGWSQEVVDVKLDASGTSLYAMFLGTSVGATLGSGCVVSAGVYASHFRSGIMKLTIATPAQLAAGTATQTLTQTPLSTQLTNANRYYEAKHNYLRFSEKLPWKPRGLAPTALAVTSDGHLAVTHANAAWGPDSNATHTVAGGYGHDDYLKPDGSAGYFSMSVFDASGNFLWQADCDSIKTEADAGGRFNDLDNPTTIAAAADASGNVYAAGRRTLALPDADGTNVFCFDRYGDFQWDQDLGTTIRALAIEPTSQRIAAGGDRTDSWPDSGGDFCQTWELRPTDGAIDKAIMDLGDVSTLSIAPASDDRLYTSSDKV